jgi:hypothetical protein
MYRPPDSGSVGTHDRAGSGNAHERFVDEHEHEHEYEYEYELTA